MRRQVKRMERKMEREDVRALRRAEGKPKRHILRKLLAGMAGLMLAALIGGWFIFDVPSWQKLDLNKITAVQQTVDRASVEWLGEAMLATKLTPKSYQYSEVFAAGNKLSKQSTAWKAPSGPSAFFVTHNDRGNPVLCITPAENALLRVQRDSDGESLILAELKGSAGQPVYYTDASARLGVVYTYRVTPINFELLQNGVLLEGNQLVQIAQAQAPSAGANLWNAIQGLFGGGTGEREASMFQSE